VIVAAAGSPVMLTRKRDIPAWALRLRGALAACPWRVARAASTLVLLPGSGPAPKCRSYLRASSSVSGALRAFACGAVVPLLLWPVLLLWGALRALGFAVVFVCRLLPLLSFLPLSRFVLSVLRVVSLPVCVLRVVSRLPVPVRARILYYSLFLFSLWGLFLILAHSPPWACSGPVPACLGLMRSILRRHTPLGSAVVPPRGLCVRLLLVLSRGLLLPFVCASRVLRLWRGSLCSRLRLRRGRLRRGRLRRGPLWVSPFRYILWG